MTDWTSGYVADVGYTFGYYPELNPLRVRLAFLDAGLVFPETGTACELGFGQGMSVNFHAAASTTSWFATDFNPVQAGFAQELAAASGAGAQLFDQSFAEFCTRPDLPDFDYIGLHGIWSWISDDNRAVIVDFVRRKLKVGGVLYISYNTQPGWAAMVPLRDLLTGHGDIMGSSGQGIISRIDAAIDFADKLLATNPIYSRANPQVVERLKSLKGQDRNYLAHEYFNRDWFPMSFATMAQWLGSAKLDFAGSANFLDHIPVINLTAEQLAFLKEIPDALFRETVRDLMVNQQFRKDYWVKGARRLNPLEQVEGLRKQKVMLVQPRIDVSLKAKGALGEATMQETVYHPILDFLSDHQPKTLGQIEQEVKDKGIVFAQIKEAALLLSGTGVLNPVQDDAVISRAKKHADKLNTHLMNKSRGNNDINYLVSPVSGGGHTVSRFQQLFLMARGQGKKQPADWAQFVWQVLTGQGQKILKDGKTLETAEENLAELTKQAQDFSDKQLPILKALGVV
jgi:SAM-dependent methyltransferase